MQEITKILGLDEDTLFDDVKEIVKYLNEEHNKKLKVFMAYDYYHSILRDLEEWLNLEISIHDKDNTIDTLYSCVLNKIQKLKEEYK